MYPIKQSTTAQPLVFYLVASSDHIAALTGATPTVTIRKVGGSFASPSGAVTEIANGWYQVAGNATDTNTLGPLLLHATATSGDPTDVCYHVVAYDPQDAVRAGLTALPNAAAEAAGGLYTRGAGAGQINQPANGRIDTNVVAIGGTTQTARDLGVSVLLSAGTGTGQLDFTSGVVKANLAQILGTALTETAGQIAAAFKQFFNIASPTSTMNLVTSVGSVTGAIGSVTGAVGSVTGAVGSVSGAVGSVTGNVGGNVTGSVGSVASGGITSGSFAAGAINAAAIATNAIDADALAADAVTEIAAGVSVGSAPTAAQNATAVRTELTTELSRIDVAISTRAASSVGGTVGSGSRLITINVQKPGSTGPLEGVACWISTDKAGTNVIGGTLDTDTSGNVQFMLDNGTYWLWRQLTPYTFTPSPQDFTVS